MRTKYFVIAIVLFCCILGGFGVIKKDSYTNIIDDEEYLNSLYVAEITEDFASSECKKLREELPECMYVLRVKAVEPVDYCYGTGRQRVRILKIYQGSNIQLEDEIFITSPRWSLILDDEVKSIERGFVNVLREDQEYLIFCTSKVDSLDKDVPTYQLYSETYVAPVFCYSELDNVIVEPGDMGTYVPYKEVRNNEFFACTEVGLQVLQSLKQELLIMYS